MKLLWVKSDFLHPTERGGQIRTLETLKRLHARHEVHYAAYADPSQPEGVRRAGEYSSKVFPVFRPPARRGSPRFAMELAKNMLSPMPAALERYESAEMRELLRTLLERERYDSVVCDFLTPAPNFASLRDCVLFQHNVETMIWRRHAEHARDPLRRLFFRVQAERMEVWERRACREAGHVIAVSPQDAETMRSMFGVERISWIPTGVDVDYFRPPATAPETADLIFLGSMDWMPNTDGVGYFVEEILPLIRRRKPEVTVAVVGRKPGAEIVALGARDGKIRVTGTVADVRPWLWGAKVSIVPLRIGGGTRLKIYESMAAGVPVVSTTVGAEGLDVRHGENIRIADTAEAFASECVDLLEDEPGRRRLARAASEMVASRFSWETISRQFEQVLTAV